MSSLPKITVVTPSFNQGHYLEATFKSVLAQEYPNLEWFVVDGGSKDNSVELIKKYEKHFNWWVSEKDRNHPHALNKGYEKATGEIFCFVNSDDLLRPGALHYVAKKFQEPGTDWVVGWATYFEDSGDEWEYSVKKVGRKIDWFLHNPVPQISSFWRTEAFKKAGPFTEKFLWGFDYEYWMRLYFVGGYRPKVVKRLLGDFRLQPNSKTVSKPENYAPDFKGIHEEYSKYLTRSEIRHWHRERKKEQAADKILKAWAALRREGPKAGRAKALEAVKHQFTSLDAWRVMYCACADGEDAMGVSPTVSVVVPVYNTERYVADTIQSILKQTFTDFELIVIDDGSKDSSPQILRDLAAKDSRIRLTVRENRGIVRTRNELLEQCRGKYMAVNDSDDLSMPDRLEQQVAYLEAHPECVLLGCRVMLIDPFGSPVVVSGQKLDHNDIEKELLGNGGGWALVQSAIMTRVDVARRIGGYRGEEHNLAEDHDLFVRLAEVGKVANLPEPLVWYRRHHTSLTHTLYQAKKQKHVEVKQWILKGAYERRGLKLPETWKFEPWQPTPREEQSRQWGWAALQRGNIAIARKHAADALKHSPLSLASWKLMACALADIEMPDSPTISVLMSVYNGEKYLAAAIDSILGQTFRDFELNVIDDGSKDSSPAILQDYAKRDPRVKLTLRENKGLTVTLNEAFAQSQGKYLARMDCDDIALPERFAKQVELLDSHPDVVCTGGHFQLIDGAGRLLTTLRGPTTNDEIQSTLLKGHNAICHPTAMIRRNAMEQAGGYDTRFKTSQDIDLWLRLGEIGKLANVPAPVLKFRLHESSVSETKREQQRKMGQLACEEAWKRRGLSNMTYEAKEPWRPGSDRASRHKFAMLYGWWALGSGERRTAMYYATKAIAAMPLKSDGWKLIACAMLKPAPSAA